MSEPIKVDIWSDVACPWCYIGKRTFEEGERRFLGAGEGRAVAVEYHSFELSPDTPVDFDGSETDFLAGHKGMGREQVAAMLDRVTRTAANVGLDYDFEALRHTNTVLAHQLLHHAKASGRQREVKERLLAAYFVEGRHLGSVAELGDLAAESGLDRAEAMAALEENRHLADVRADEESASRLGIGAVPFFVIDGQYGISGAQPADTFEAALQRVWSERADQATGDSGSVMSATDALSAAASAAESTNAL